MRFVSLGVLASAAATLSLSTATVAQTCPGGEVVQPAYNNTFTSASATRGYFFQAPVGFTIDALNVPDEGLLGEQNVQLYIDNAPPPAFSGTSNPPLVFGAYAQPTATPISTGPGGIPVAPGQWVIVVGAASAPASTTMANSYGPAGTFATTIGGVPVSISRCGTQTSIGANQGANPIWSEVNGQPSRVEMCVTITGSVPPTLVGVSEPTLNSGTLGTAGATFRELEFLRWNYDDSVSSGANLGQFAVTTHNFGGVGGPPIGVTPQIPGLIQVWAGSTPSGVAFLSGPHQVGNPDAFIFIPPNIFSNGQTLRLQALILDPNAAGSLPVTPMFNTLTFTFTDCGYIENFDGLAQGTALPAGWTQSGTQPWRVDAAGTPSTATGPTAALTLPNYLYAETSTSAGSTYIFDTAPVPSSSAPTNTLSFALSRIGATIGTLNISMFDGTSAFNQIATYTGPDPGQAQNAVEWSFENVDLTAGNTLVVPANIVLRFDYTRGTSFTGDLAIDDLCLK